MKKNNWNSFYQKGLVVEQRFIDMIGDSFIRKASKTEDRNEHWDILCEHGRIDVKGMKKSNRSDAKTNADIHFYEFRNVGGNSGWGLPNEVERMIAFETEEDFILVNPEDIYEPLIQKCSKHGEGWGLFQCRGREGRDDWFTKVPTEFLREHSCGIVEPVSGIRMHD